MKIEEVISSTIMFVVSGLVLIGFTIAWFTNMKMGPTVTGIELVAVEEGDIKVALTSKGPDISKLDKDKRYAEINYEKILDVDAEGQEKLAPGTCGQVTFYVTPINSNVKSCEVVPMARVTQDGKTWYPKIESMDEDSSTDGTAGEGEDESGNESVETAENEEVVTIESLYEIVTRHIEFYTDASMTEEFKITEDNPFQLTWTVNDWDSNTKSMKEKTVTIYWKWHYEYPFTTEQLSGDNKLSEAKRKELIDTYDEEDMIIGNNLSGMKFYFTFTAR